MFNLTISSILQKPNYIVHAYISLRGDEGVKFLIIKNDRKIQDIKCHI